MTSGENVYSLVVSGNPKYHLLIYQYKLKKNHGEIPDHAKYFS